MRIRQYARHFVQMVFQGLRFLGQACEQVSIGLGDISIAKFRRIIPFNGTTGRIRRRRGNGPQVGLIRGYHGSHSLSFIVFHLFARTLHACQNGWHGTERGGGRRL